MFAPTDGSPPLAMKAPDQQMYTYDEYLNPWISEISHTLECIDYNNNNAQYLRFGWSMANIARTTNSSTYLLT